MNVMDPSRSPTTSERGEAFQLTDEQRAELERRWAAQVEDPNAVIPGPWCERDFLADMSLGGARLRLTFEPKVRL